MTVCFFRVNYRFFRGVSVKGNSAGRGRNSCGSCVTKWCSHYSPPPLGQALLSKHTMLSRQPLLQHYRANNELTETQLLCLKSINKQFQVDYSVRRKMLLQRLEVTLQSFLWSRRESAAISVQFLPSIIRSIVSSRLMC